MTTSYWCNDRVKLRWGGWMQGVRVLNRIWLVTRSFSYSWNDTTGLKHISKDWVQNVMKGAFEHRIYASSFFTECTYEFTALSSWAAFYIVCGCMPLSLTKLNHTLWHHQCCTSVQLSFSVLTGELIHAHPGPEFTLRHTHSCCLCMSTALPLFISTSSC